jgi:uncharacterized protein (AIM24 family)
MSGIDVSAGIIGAEGAAKYAIIGGDCQILNVKLEPTEGVRCEPGMLMHMDPRITPNTSFACSCGRACAGESQWSSTFTNKTSSPLVVGLTPNTPAKVVPIDLTTILAGGAKSLRFQQGAWMASIGKVNLSIGTQCNPCRCCCAGQGAVSSKVTGDGTVFLEGHGTVMTKLLGAGEKLVVDQDSVLAWADTVDLNFRLAGGCCACCCAGEGMFNTVLDGGDKGGMVILQSMPFGKFKKAILNPGKGQRGGKTANV